MVPVFLNCLTFFKKFKFGVEVLELARYQNKAGEQVYRFYPFLADIDEDLGQVEKSELNTVVVPARPEGVKETFLGEDRWHKVSIHSTMRSQIKYIAVYQIKPISAITDFSHSQGRTPAVAALPQAADIRPQELFTLVRPEDIEGRSHGNSENRGSCVRSKWRRRYLGGTPCVHRQVQLYQ